MALKTSAQASCLSTSRSVSLRTRLAVNCQSDLGMERKVKQCMSLKSVRTGTASFICLVSVSTVEELTEMNRSSLLFGFQTGGKLLAPCPLLLESFGLPREERMAQNQQRVSVNNSLQAR